LLQNGPALLPGILPPPLPPPEKLFARKPFAGSWIPLGSANSAPLIALLPLFATFTRAPHQVSLLAEAGVCYTPVSSFSALQKRCGRATLSQTAAQGHLSKGAFIKTRFFMGNAPTLSFFFPLEIMRLSFFSVDYRLFPPRSFFFFLTW